MYTCVLQNIQARENEFNYKYIHQISSMHKQFLLQGTIDIAVESKV